MRMLDTSGYRFRSMDLRTGLLHNRVNSHGFLKAFHLLLAEAVKLEWQTLWHGLVGGTMDANPSGLRQLFNPLR